MTPRAFGTTILVPGNPPIACDAAGQGKLLVFLHGIGGNRSNWAEQVEHCSANFHAVAWDARGYGGSGDDPRDGPPLFTDYADDLLRLIDHFGAERAHICGLSMGGRIAMEDRLTSPAMGRAIAARIPQGRFLEIHGAGHLSNIEAPMAFNLLLDAFLPY